MNFYHNISFFTLFFIVYTIPDVPHSLPLSTSTLPSAYLPLGHHHTVISIYSTDGKHKACGLNPALHLVLSGPAPCFYPMAVPSSLPLVKEQLHLYSPKITFGPLKATARLMWPLVKMNFTPLVYKLCILACWPIFTFFYPVPPPPFPSDSCQSVPCICASVFILFINLFCSLDCTYK